MAWYSVLHRAASLAALLFTGCAAYQEPRFDAFVPQDLTPMVKSGHARQRIENVQFLLDASSSMDDSYEAGGFAAGVAATEFEAEKEIMSRVIQTIPDLRLNAGLQTFGFGRCLPWAYTDLQVPFGPYSGTAFQAALAASKCAGDGPSLAVAIRKASDPLASVPGRSALIIFSDGEHPRDVLAHRISVLKQQFGDRLCVHSVWVGNREQAGQALLAELPRIASCGMATTVQDIASSNGMAQFVKHVFLYDSR